MPECYNLLLRPLTIFSQCTLGAIVVSAVIGLVSDIPTPVVYAYEPFSVTSNAVSVFAILLYLSMTQSREAKLVVLMLWVWLDRLTTTKLPSCGAWIRKIFSLGSRPLLSPFFAGSSLASYSQ